MNTATKLAFVAFLGKAGSTPFADAFTPTSLLVAPNHPTSVVVPSKVAFTLNMSSNYLDDDDDDDDFDDDDDDDDFEMTAYSDLRSPFTGLKLDPWDPNPLIKPAPSPYWRKERVLAERIPDDQLVQTMTPEERKENLTVMRQILNKDLDDLNLRQDHAGWVEANNDLKRREKRDPWYGVNERLREAIQMGEPQEKIDYLKDLWQKMGGPPPDVEMRKSPDYALHSEIMKTPMSLVRMERMVQRELAAENAREQAIRVKEYHRNKLRREKEAEAARENNEDKWDQDAEERREIAMQMNIEAAEQREKERIEREKELLEQYPDMPKNGYESWENTMKIARQDLWEMGRGDSSALPSTDDEDVEDRPKSGAQRAREAAAAEAAGGRPRLPGDEDVTLGEIEVPVVPSSSTVTGPLKVEVSSAYNKEQSDPPMRKHCFQYTIRITNNSPTDTIQLLGRRFEIQTVGSSMKDVVQGEGVTGRTPVLKPGEVFEYTSTAPLSVRPIGTTIIAARMRGEYRYEVLPAGQETATDDQVKSGGNEMADLGTFHFIFPEDQRVKPYRAEEDDDDYDDDDDDDDEDDAPAPRSMASTAPAQKKETASRSTPSSTLPGDEDMKTGMISLPLNDKSEVVTDSVRVSLTSSYRPERSESSQDKYCFAYNIRITNESDNAIKLVSRRFEIQSVGLPHKDVVSGPGVTGRQPILKPGESFEYTSTAPLNVKPMLDKTPVLARMSGEYNFVILGEDGETPLSSTPLQAKLGLFHFILPALSAS